MNPISLLSGKHTYARPERLACDYVATSVSEPFAFIGRMKVVDMVSRRSNPPLTNKAARNRHSAIQRRAIASSEGNSQGLRLPSPSLNQRSRVWPGQMEGDRRVALGFSCHRATGGVVSPTKGALIASGGAMSGVDGQPAFRGEAVRSAARAASPRGSPARGGSGFPARRARATPRRRGWAWLRAACSPPRNWPARRRTGCPAPPRIPARTWSVPVRSGRRRRGAARGRSPARTEAGCRRRARPAHG